MVFNYDYEKLLVSKLISNNRGPLQIELQTGMSCGGYNCPHCYGKLQDLNRDSYVPVEKYLSLLDDVKGKTNSIMLAGIKSDPLANIQIYEIIKKIKDNDFSLGIHTKGFLLNDKIIELLAEKTKEGDFITFSVESGNIDTYNKLHGVKGTIFYKKSRDNISSLYLQKLKEGSQLDINVASLLMKENSSYEEMKTLIEIYKDYSDRIRFSFPQVPNKDEVPENFLSEKEIDEVKEDLQTLQFQYPDVDIIVLESDESEHNTCFKKCRAQQFQFVVDNSGYVFPCPQVTLKQFNHLSWGNIKEQSFDEIWNGAKRKKVLNMNVSEMNCRICDRKDEAWNNYLEGDF